MTMTKPVNRSLSNVVKKRLLCFSIALLLCILAYVYQSISGTGTGHSFAANVPDNTIGGVVFNDANGNGKLDAHEGSISHVTVHLYHTDGRLAGTAVTDDRGGYSFNITPNTNYQIKLDNAADYTTGPLKGHRLTAVHSDTCDDQMNSNAVLPDDSNYLQIPVDSHASAYAKHSFDAAFTTGTDSAIGRKDNNGILKSLCSDCQPCSDEPPTSGSKPELKPTPEPKKPAPAPKPKQAPGKQAAVPPTTYPKLPATGGDPAGHLFP